MKSRVNGKISKNLKKPLFVTAMSMSVLAFSGTAIVYANDGWAAVEVGEPDFDDDTITYFDPSIFATDRPYVTADTFDLDDVVDVEDVLWEYICEEFGVSGGQWIYDGCVYKQGDEYGFLLKYSSGAHQGFFVNCDTGNISCTELFQEAIDMPLEAMQASNVRTPLVNIVTYVEANEMNAEGRLMGLETYDNLELAYTQLEPCNYTVDDSIGRIAYRSSPSYRYYADFGDISGVEVKLIYQDREFSCVTPVVDGIVSSNWGYVPTNTLIQHEPPKDTNYAQYSENDVLEMCRRYIAYKDNLSWLPENVAIESVDGFFVTCWYYLNMPDHVSTLGRYTIDTRTGKGTDEWTNEIVDFTLY